MTPHVWANRVVDILSVKGTPYPIKVQRIASGVARVDRRTSNAGGRQRWLCPLDMV